MNVILWSIYFVIATFVGCSSSDAPTIKDPKSSGFQADRDWLLVQSVSNNLITDRMNSLVDQTTFLESKVQKACTQSTFDLSELREIWSQAMFDFHYLDALTFGPVASFDENSPLRFIYSHPPVNAPQYIAREIAKASEKKESYKMPRPLAHSIGLNALEYVLFNPQSESLNLTSESGECHYLKFILADLKARVIEYRTLWMQEEVAFINSVEGRTRLPEVIGRLASHIIVYTDKLLKDRKLGGPLGLQQKLFPCENALECQSIYLEHPFYPESKIALEAPLHALNDLFNGLPLKQSNEKTYSLNEYLISLNESNRNNPSTQLSDWLNQVDQLPTGDGFKDKFNKFKASDKYNSMFQLLQEIRTLTTWLKTDFLIELNSSLPEPAQGDTD